MVVYFESAITLPPYRPTTASSGRRRMPAAWWIWRCSPQVYMNARFYDPAVGQFVSPDTLAPDAANLSDYNRYMYVRGSPLRYTDPSGHRATHWIGDPDDGEDGLCWALAYTIANIWNETDIGLTQTEVDKTGRYGL